jgi:hypothetical protein
LRTRLAKLTTGPPEKVADHVRLLNMMSAAVLGLAVAGAFLSVTYYPHLFIVTGMCIAARCIAARELQLKPEQDTKQKIPVRGRAARPA